MVANNSLWNIIECTVYQYQSYLSFSFFLFHAITMNFVLNYVITQGIYRLLFDIMYMEYTQKSIF